MPTLHNLSWQDGDSGIADGSGGGGGRGDGPLRLSLPRTHPPPPQSAFIIFLDQLISASPHFQADKQYQNWHAFIQTIDLTQIAFPFGTHRLKRSTHFGLNMTYMKPSEWLAQQCALFRCPIIKHFAPSTYSHIVPGNFVQRFCAGSNFVRFLSSNFVQRFCLITLLQKYKHIILQCFATTMYTLHVFLYHSFSVQNQCVSAAFWAKTCAEFTVWTPRESRECKVQPPRSFATRRWWMQVIQNLDGIEITPAGVVPGVNIQWWMGSHKTQDEISITIEQFNWMHL